MKRAQAQALALKGRILEALSGAPGGLTTDALAQRLFSPARALSPRLSELAEAGAVVKAFVGGETIWSVPPRGPAA